MIQANDDNDESNNDDNNLVRDRERIKSLNHQGDDGTKIKNEGIHMKTKTMFDITAPKIRALKIPKAQTNHYEDIPFNSQRTINNEEALNNDGLHIMRKNADTKVIPSEFRHIDTVSSSLRKSSQFKTLKEQEIIRNIIIAERECDNDYETNEWFIKLKTEEFNTAYITIVSIASSYFYHDLTKYPNKTLIEENPDLHNILRLFLLCINLICAIIFILFSINRYLILLKLNISMNQITHKTTFWTRDYFGLFLLESLLAIIHPNLFNKDYTFTTNAIIYIQEIEYEINDIFIFITYLRFYVIFRFFISMSQFHSARAFRISKLIGNRLDRLYVVKCIIMVNPIMFLAISTVIFIVILGFMLRLIEGAAYDEGSGDNDYRMLSNCIWNVIVTMTTVGYGDYYPVTTVGRIVCVIATVGGTCLTSFMVITLQNSLQFSENEEKAFNFREKKLMRDKLEKKAANFFKCSFQFLAAKKKFHTAINNGQPREKIRKLNHRMKACLYKKIDSKKKFKTLAKVYRNTYEVLSEFDILKSKLDDFQEQLTLMQNDCELMELYVEKITSVLDEIGAIQKN